MTQQEILDSNKLIAEFMGLEIITDGISWFDTNYKSLGNYDSSWDLLMPVVEKIQNYKTAGLSTFVSINSGSVYIKTFSIKGCFIEFNQFKNNFHEVEYHKQHGFVFQSEFNMDFAIKIEVVWLAVVEFIKWYNLNKI